MKQLRKPEARKLFKEQPKRKQEIALVLENIQYARNVAGIFRTADAAKVSHLYLTGISQHPPFGKELQKASRSKEKSVNWSYEQDTLKVIAKLKKQKYTLIAVELTDTGVPLSQLAKLIKGIPKVAFLVGSEVFGVTRPVLAECDHAVFVPMYGRGASLNVAVTAGVVLYAF